MKPVLLIFISLIGILPAVAQKGKKKSQPAQETTEQVQPQKQEEQPQQQSQPAQQQVNPLGEHFAKKYAVASRWNDFDIVKEAMYDLIIEYPGSDSLIHALAVLYYENQKYPSSVLICQDLLARNPKNVAALELAGLGYEGLNLFDRALQNYESLYLLTNNSNTLYKMAFLQFQLKRYPECLTNVEILLTKPEADTQKLIFPDAQNKEKEYAMRVGLLNLKGMAYREQADKVNAKKAFDEALKIAPDFQPAKQNLANLK
ncbi:MAG: hypothetical protein JST46_17855 [Bacteroidetes bacterium]|nr:hypothetical protein [Bacteroidota bacterium]